jgi:hypothetical protein
MTTIGNTYLTLLDYGKRVKPTGGLEGIIEVLAASNPILADANVMEGNLPTGHLYTQRASQPSGNWRLLNYGVASEKSTTKQFTDVCAILESYSEVDVDLATLGGNAPAFRESEDRAFVAGMNSTMATALIYGNQGENPEQIHGLAPRYNSLTGNFANYIKSASGSGGDNTSIWLITWGPSTCSMIFPKGSTAGLMSEDLGKVLVYDTTALKHLCYVTKFQWKTGLAVMDPRYVIRICNIDVSDLTSDASSGADLIDKMIDAFYARPTDAVTKEDAGMARTFWYCNKTVAAYLHKQAMSPTNVQLTLREVGGRRIPELLGAPIHVCDNITSAEATVS